MIVGQTVRDALNEHLSALQARDVDRFAATLGADASLVDGAGTIVRGTGAVLASHAAWFAEPDAWTFDYDVVFARDMGDAGLALIDVTYRERADAVPARFLLSLVFERDDDGALKFIYDQNTTPHRV